MAVKCKLFYLICIVDMQSIQTISSPIMAAHVRLLLMIQLRRDILKTVWPDDYVGRFAVNSSFALPATQRSKAQNAILIADNLRRG